MRRAAIVGCGSLPAVRGRVPMTHGSKRDPKKLGEFRGIGFGLGPPQPGGWSFTTHEESSPSSRDDQTPATPKGAGSGTEGPEHVAAGRSLYEAGEQFATRLQLLLTYRREIGTVARATSFANTVSIFALLSDMAEASRDRDGTDALASFSFDLLVESEGGSVRRLSARGPIYEHHHVTAVQNRVKYNDAALRLLHEASVQQLVNSYERLIGDIARLHIFENTQEAAKDQSLTYRQILEFGSIDEVKRAVVEAQVRDLIRHSDTLEQLEWLRKRLNVDVRSQFPGIGAFRGLEFRRHAIVHAGGIATSEYMRRLGVLGETESAAEGTPLTLSSAYIDRSWDVVYALGIVTIHLASVARAKGLCDAEQEETADGQLNTAAVWAIKQQRYGAAERILEYAHKRRLSKTTYKLMVLVNLAQTYKWQGRNEECKDLLIPHDWEATSDQFRLCVAVLRDEDAEDYLTRAVKSGDISLFDLYEWPVFSKFRERDEFPAIVERVFGPDARPPLEKFPASLLDFSHEDTLREIFQHLERVSREVTHEGHPGAGKDDDVVH